MLIWGIALAIEVDPVQEYIQQSRFRELPAGPDRQRPNIARRYRGADLVAEDVFKQEIESVGKLMSAFITKDI